MAELAGLVLGGIPVAIWALEKYAEPLETYRRYGTSIKNFQADLITQKRQLQTTLLNIGLPDDASLEDIRECFETKYPEVSQELMIIIQRMDEATATLLKSLEIEIQAKACWNNVNFRDVPLITNP